MTESTAEKPKGPYTVWVDGDYGWKPNDFPTLQEALEWEGKGANRFVITKPVQYRVQEIGASARFTPLHSVVDDVDELNAPPDPNNPDSGRARYV